MTQNKKQKKYSSGFTLIEIMLVILIIGILAAMAVPRLVGRSQEAKITATRADIESNLSVALDLFELDNGAYPTTDQGLAGLVEKPSGGASNWNGPYLKKTPKDPWAHPYVYKCPGEHNTSGFDLSSNGPDATEGTQDDISNWHGA
ncbi:MAG: type II secretion system major pseudopilin GspG [Chlamydiae bacterium]|nr:type II secretion system major pseudopilin GspG [Chlamydiota bacterium]MBI3276727.1 type II secretion system major pseudopilin GspG [Chlamydiota bacterium]